MQINDIFQKDISRPINGVVKADQLSESVIWQELDEYVITRELDQHFRKFLSAYSSALDMPNDPAVSGRMGVWVSGFFGSGKSHFIKILSYVLGNHVANDPESGTGKKAIDFFKNKISDPMLLADLKRAAGHDTDVILFNIDSRADASDGRASLLSVFWRVFNERLGYCSQSLHVAELERYLDKKGDIIKNQLSFSSDSSTLKNYASASDFIANYPFAPFHFQLVQKIFESIRKAGATGLHLSRGERSMLDAFQSAANSIKSKDIGALVPLYEFYPCIESFLDTSVKRSIEQAKDNAGLEIPLDVQILQALFLIRYVNIIRPNVENLVTLCIDQVDADRIALKRNVEGALQRLEKEKLINRNGDLYFFLTNEEREVAREIDKVEISGSAETELLGDIIFTDILKGKTKHRYADYNRDYAFNRICDGRFRGKELQDELGLEIISPLHDDYDLFIPAKCILYSANQDGNLIVKIDNDPDLVNELRLSLQVDKYIRDKSDAAASSSLKQILRSRADENRERRSRLIARVDSLLSRAEFYAMGKRIDIEGQTTSKSITDGLDYLVKNIFSKFNYLTSVSSDPINEIKQILQSDDVAQHQLSLALIENEPADIKEVLGYIKMKISINHPVILDELVKHFAKRPYGWGEFQVVVLITKMFMAGAISLIVDQSKVKPRDAFASLSKTHQWKNIKIIETPIIDKKALDTGKILAKELFGSIPPEGQDKLSRFIVEGLSKWIQTLEKYKPLADTGNYPGKKEIDACLDAAGKITRIHDSFEVIKAFNTQKDDLKDAADDLHALSDFYTNQRKTWEKLKEAMKLFLPNKSALDKNPEAERALKRMQEIADAASPYPMLKEVEGLISKVENINRELLKKNRDASEGELDSMISQLTSQRDNHKADADFKNEILYPIQQIKKKIDVQFSIPEILYHVAESQALYEDAGDKIEEKFLPPVTGKAKQIKTIKAASVVPKIYIESEADADGYVNKLRAELLEAINNNFRVKIV